MITSNEDLMMEFLQFSKTGETSENGNGMVIDRLFKADQKSESQFRMPATIPPVPSTMHVTNSPAKFFQFSGGRGPVCVPTKPMQIHPVQYKPVQHKPVQAKPIDRNGFFNNNLNVAVIPSSKPIEIPATGEEMLKKVSEIDDKIRNGAAITQSECTIYFNYVEFMEERRKTCIKGIAKCQSNRYDYLRFIDGYLAGIANCVRAMTEAKEKIEHFKMKLNENDIAMQSLNRRIASDLIAIERIQKVIGTKPTTKP